MHIAAKGLQNRFPTGGHVGLLGEFIHRQVQRFSEVEIYPERPPQKILTWRHPAEVAKSSVALADKLGYTNLEEIAAAALFHDVGKIHEDMVTVMQWKDTWPEQFKEVFREAHTRLGVKMLDQLKLGELAVYRPLMNDVCLYHHTPYNVNLEHDRRSEIGIVRVCDVHDAMTSGEEERNYREKRYSIEEAAHFIWSATQVGQFNRRTAKTFIEGCLGLSVVDFQ